MTESNFWNKEFILSYGSAGIRIHHGGEAWQPEQEVEYSYPQPQAQSTESELKVNEALKSQALLPSDIFPPLSQPLLYCCKETP